MKKIIICCFVLLGVAFSATAQTTKKIETVNELWFTYLNQLRFSNKWELATDFNLRTKDEFINDLSVSIIRLGLTYYLGPNTKLSAGYAWVNFFPAANHQYVSQTEHRPWQQFQWITNYGRTRMIQSFRLEERFRRKILNDSTLGTGTNFNGYIDKFYCDDVFNFNITDVLCKKLLSLTTNYHIEHVPSKQYDRFRRDENIFQPHRLSRRCDGRIL